MKPSIFTSFDRTVPFREAVSMIRRAGFDVVALDGYPAYSGYNTSAGRVAIRELLRHNGLQADSVHAPLPEGNYLCSPDTDKRRESIRFCRMAMETAALLDAGVVVVHLGIPYNIADEKTLCLMMDHGRRSLTVLSGCAREYGVKLALENGRRADWIYDALLAEFDDPVGLCFDTGHANIIGAGFKLLEKHSRRLLSFHIHDNMADKDTHLLPFEGNIDWEEFTRLIRCLGLTHNLHVESHPKHSQFKAPEVFLAEAKRRADLLVTSHGRMR